MPSRKKWNLHSGHTDRLNMNLSGIVEVPSSNAEKRMLGIAFTFYLIRGETGDDPRPVRR